MSTVTASAPEQSDPSKTMPIPNGDLIVFDRDCVICSGFARFIARTDTDGRFRFVTAQSDLGRALYRQHDLDADLMETNIVIVDGQAFVKMASFAAAMRALGWPWRALAIVDMVPRPVADWLYDRIALNRYRFGRRQCPVPSPELRARIIA